MFKKSVLAAAAVAALALVPVHADAAGKIKIGFLPGVVDRSIRSCRSALSRQPRTSVSR